MTLWQLLNSITSKETEAPRDWVTKLKPVNLNLDELTLSLEIP